MPITSSDQAKVTKTQHTSPCSDCPFRRNSIPGWLGSMPPEFFVHLAHSDARYDCHTKKADVKTFHQCAGMAIFRDNICKSPRDPNVLQLDGNTVKVFSDGQEFINHHRDRGLSRS